MNAEERVSWALQHLPGQAGAVLELRRTGGGVAAHGDAPGAGDPGHPDRHRLSVSGDLSLRRRARSAARRSISRSTSRRCRRPGSRPRYGRLWEQGVEGIERYNELRKTEPMRRALEELGIAQLVRGSAARAVAQPQPHPAARVARRSLEGVSDLRLDGSRRVRVPDAGTTCRITRSVARGYVSIGDWHTTRTLAEAGDDEEATRFFGLKRECGLHGLEG